MQPSAGKEQRGRHAGLILSAWQFNRATGFAYIAPIMTVGTSFGCDQVSKNMARKNIDLGERIELVSDNFILTKVENTGAFLSLGSSLPSAVRTILLLLLPALALAIILYITLTNKNLDKTALVGLSFIIGGGIGNIYDRLVYGSVTDFMYLDLILFRTGIFNVADVSIMTGVAAMVIHYLNKRKSFEPK